MKQRWFPLEPLIEAARREGQLTVMSMSMTTIPKAFPAMKTGVATRMVGASGSDILSSFSSIREA